MITSFKLVVLVVLAAFPPAWFSRGHPESLT
jgi:hypothetical protein